MSDTLTPTESTRGQLGQGIYTLAELQLYLAFYGEPEDGPLALRWLGTVLNPVAHAPRQPDYSFSDLISLFVVRELLRLGVAAREIRTAEQNMRARFGLDRPFVSEEVATDGRTVFARSDVAEQLEAAGRSAGQQVDRRVIGPYLSRVQYSHGEASSWSPASGIHLHPAIQFGEPVVAGTRVPTAALADLAEAESVEVAADRLGVKLPAAQAAVRFERKLAALRN